MNYSKTFNLIKRNLQKTGGGHPLTAPDYKYASSLRLLTTMYRFKIDDSPHPSKWCSIPDNEFPIDAMRRFQSLAWDRYNGEKT